MNWTPLLQWSLAHHDGTRPADIKPMSEEEKAWLSKAMDSLVVDEVKRMKIISEVLQWPEEAGSLRDVVDSSTELHIMRSMADEGKDEQLIKTEEKLAIPQDDNELLKALVAKKKSALEELDDLVLTIDKACDFHKVGGFPHLFKELRSRHASLRILAAQALSTIVQNNPKGQAWALELDAFVYIKDLLLDSEQSVVKKGLLVLSSLIRGNIGATQKFVHMGGLELVCSVLAAAAASAAVQGKVLNLLRYLVTFKECNAADRLFSKNSFSLLLSLIGNENTIVSENTAGLLADLLKERPGPAKVSLLDPKLSPAASPVLAGRLKALRSITEIEEKDVVADEMDSLQAIMQMLFAKAPEMDEEYQAVLRQREAQEVAEREAEAARRRAIAEREGEIFKEEEARRRELGQQQLLLHHVDDAVKPS